MTRRGVLYVVWGDGIDELLDRSIESVRRIHPELGIEVERLPGGSTLLDKARMMEWTPFDETLYLDADTVVMDRLDFAFERAARFGLACSICECPWARRYGGLTGDVVEYNTGVLFFDRKARPVFDRWAEVVGSIDSSLLFYQDGELCNMPYNDQAGFADAMHELGFAPFVLPYNWNLRPRGHRSFWGPIKIWHDALPVPDGLERWNENQIAPENPIQYTELR